MIIVHSNTLNSNQIQTIEQTLKEKLNFKETHYQINSEDINSAREISQKFKIDVNLIPKNFDKQQIKLIISDMDSTLINIECIDEIADFAKLKPQVARITNLAMQGKLGFNQALVERVELLKNLEVNVLEKVYQERLKLNNGAEDLIKKSKALGIKFALVSGGFNFFTDKLKDRLNLDFAKANVLQIKNNRLTGKIDSEIINAQKKAYFLQQICQKLNIKPSQTIAVGDGANDLNMMKIAGLSVAYHAKEKVKQQAQTQINYLGLDKIIDFLL